MYKLYRVTCSLPCVKKTVSDQHSEVTIKSAASHQRETGLCECTCYFMVAESLLIFMQNRVIRQKAIKTHTHTQQIKMKDIGI